MYPVPCCWTFSLFREQSYNGHLCAANLVCIHDSFPQIVLEATISFDCWPVEVSLWSPNLCQAGTLGLGSEGVCARHDMSSQDGGIGMLSYASLSGQQQTFLWIWVGKTVAEYSVLYLQQALTVFKAFLFVVPLSLEVNGEETYLSSKEVKWLS